MHRSGAETEDQKGGSVLMRMIHTADWHLGHTLAGHSRAAEHDVFLATLLDTLERDAADALLIAGDVYDQGHPPAYAQHQLFTFLATARRRCPDLAIVVIGGNHDAAARLDAPAPVLDGIGVTMVGGMRRHGSILDYDAAVIPLRLGKGPNAPVAAVIAAVPFLRAPELSAAMLEQRPVDHLPSDGDAVDTDAAARIGTGTESEVGRHDGVVIDGTRLVLDRVVARARARFPGVPVIAMSHCEMQGARLSLTSERPLFGGRHALPETLFADVGVDYAALGHLHLAQGLGPGERARYSGSPLPLSMAERHYRHQVVCVDVDGAGAPVEIRPILMPRPVDFIRVPDDGVDDLPRVLDRLAALEVPDLPLGERPFLEVRVRLDKPVPDLRSRIETALAGKSVRLVRIERETTGDRRSLPEVVGSLGANHDDANAALGLKELSPLAVFRALYGRQFESPPRRALVDAVQELLDADRDRQVGPAAHRVPGISSTTTPSATTTANSSADTGEVV